MDDDESSVDSEADEDKAEPKDSVSALIMGFNPHAKKAPPPPELPPRDGTSDIEDEDYITSSVGVLPETHNQRVFQRRGPRSIDTD